MYVISPANLLFVKMFIFHNEVIINLLWWGNSYNIIYDILLHVHNQHYKFSDDFINIYITAIIFLIYLYVPILPGNLFLDIDCKYLLTQASCFSW